MKSIIRENREIGSTFILWICLLFLVSCSSGNEDETEDAGADAREANSDTDTDTDTDTDADGDGDSDGDADTDADTDTDADAAPVFWGSCGPPDLEGEVPDEVFDAVEAALSPGGFLDRNGLSCEAGEETTLETPYRSGHLDPSLCDLDAGSEAFFVFHETYLDYIACDGAYHTVAEVMKKDGVWEVSGGGKAPPIYKTLDPLFRQIESPDCIRGYVLIDATGRDCVVVTDAQEGTRIFPVSGLESGEWGEEYRGMQPGDVSLTKEEFLAWCREQDFGY